MAFDLETKLQEATLPQEGQGLRFLILEITGGCNLACVHCYADSSPQAFKRDVVPTNRWKEIIDEAVQLDCKNAQFIGGEPTLHTDFLEILQYAHQSGLEQIEVYTNATAITDALIDVFKDLGTRVATSFYSKQPEIHEKVTQRKGSFERTVEGIKKLVAAGIPLRVGVIRTPHNDSRENIKEALGYLHELGVNEAGEDRVRGVGRGSLLKQEDPYSALCGKCWTGRLTVTSTGDVYPCVFSRFETVGNILTTPLQEILDYQNLAAFKTKIYSVYLSKSTGKRIDTNNVSVADPCWPWLYEPEDCMPNICSPS